jgi:hypothetical protein
MDVVLTTEDTDTAALVTVDTVATVATDTTADTTDGEKSSLSP